MIDSTRDEWLTRREVAELVRVSVATLKRWRRLGIGPPGRRVGPRLVRYRRRDVAAWLAEDQDRYRRSRLPEVTSVT